MMNLSYVFRLAYGSVVAILVTIILGLIVMWMNGLLVEEQPNSEAYTPCVFGSEIKDKVIKDPFSKRGISLECVNRKESKPLVMQWFEKIFDPKNEQVDKLNNFIKKD